MKRKSNPNGIAFLKKKADKIFSLYIRYRGAELQDDIWYNTCITCGIRRPIKELQNGHFVGRTASITRFNEENCNCQCMGCNVFKHGDLYNYSLKLDQKYGEGTANSLHLLGQQTYKFTAIELQEIITTSEERIAEFESLGSSSIT